jgi:hypothetical protein
MPKIKPAKTPENRPLSSEELNQLRNKAYWINAHKLKVVSADPMLYPRSLWNKVKEEYQKNNKRSSNEGWNNGTVL